MSRIIPSHWGHQTAFRTEVHGLACAVFDELDARLKPQIYLLGLVADHEDGVYPLFLDTPGEESSTELFQDAARRSKEVRARLYAEAQAAGEEMVGDAKRRIVLEAWRQAVEAALERSDRGKDVISFCSAPRPVKEFLVCTVLRMSRTAWRSYYALPKDDADRRAHRPESLLDATVEQFLRRCAVGLAERHAGLSASLVDADPGEILRAAGRLVSDAPALGGQRDLNLHGLYHACNTLAAMRYEGASTQGRLIISAREHAGVIRRVSFHRPVDLADHTAVRKLLETHRPGYSLLADGAQVYGLGHMDLASSVPERSLFNVTFLQHYTWELAYGLRPLMRVSYGHPRLPEEALREGSFRRLCARAFGGRADVDALWHLAEPATRQAHGTLVVIHAAAASELERLKQQAAPIEPRALDEDGVLAVTAVDGAVLADPSGVIHGFGVILDGPATEHGNPARGARYNSAVRYVRSSDVPCVAVVVSEDGTVDLLSTADD